MRHTALVRVAHSEAVICACGPTMWWTATAAAMPHWVTEIVVSEVNVWAHVDVHVLMQPVPKDEVVCHRDALRLHWVARPIVHAS